MYQKVKSIYNVLALGVVMTALFVLYPSKSPELTAYQHNIQHQVSIAWQQTIGDQPWFGDVADIYDGVASFYDQSTTATISMFSSPESDADIYFVFHQVYKNFAFIFSGQGLGHVAGASVSSNIAQAPMPANFMTEPAIDNISPEIPPAQPSADLARSSVSGASVSMSQPVNSAETPWVTISDNSTGQLYCLAVYNGTVNKYIGPCKDDYH